MFNTLQWFFPSQLAIAVITISYQILASLPTNLLWFSSPCPAHSFQPHLLVFKKSICNSCMNIFAFYLFSLETLPTYNCIACFVIFLRSLTQTSCCQGTFISSSPSYCSKHVSLHYFCPVHISPSDSLHIYLFIHLFLSNWNKNKLHEGKEFVCFDRCCIYSSEWVWNVARDLKTIYILCDSERTLKSCIWKSPGMPVCCLWFLSPTQP